MHATYYAYHALVSEWQDLLGTRLIDAFTQQRGELTLAFEAADTVHRVQIGTKPVYLFRSEGYTRAKRNTTTLFETIQGLIVKAVRVADRDRFVFLDLRNDSGTPIGTLWLILFGSRANVLWTRDGETVAEAFQHSADLEGESLPTTRPAPLPANAHELSSRWKGDDPARALRRAWPLFDDLLVREALHRADFDGGAPDWPALFAACTDLHAHALVAQSPGILWRGEIAQALTLVALEQPISGLRLEPLPTVDRASQVFTRRTLGQERFAARYDKLHGRLKRASHQATRRVDQVLEALSQPSRADEHESAGHLLMAQLHRVDARTDSVELDDLFSADGGTRLIGLDPALSPAANAERYYARARASRLSRASSEERFERSHDEAERLSATLAELETVRTLDALDAFEAAHGEWVRQSTPDAQAESLPYRVFEIGSGYQAWVGKGAHQNDKLTLHHARPFDLWMHARGTPGSHVIVRLRGRDDTPPPIVMERAAALAAWYSKQRGSSLVPVIHSPRKHVRKPKGAPPGSVRVLREETLLVAPGVWKP